MKPKRNDSDGDPSQLISSKKDEAPALPLTTRSPAPQAAGLTIWLAPTPVTSPEVDPQITRLSPIERSAEVLRYSIRRAEYWLSPEGLLREWIRRILRLAMALAVPTVLLAPLITLLLFRLQAWSASVLEIVQNISKIPAQLSSGLFFAGVAYLLFRWLMR